MSSFKQFDNVIMDDEAAQLTFMRRLAYFAIVMSTVATCICIVGLPLLLNHLQQVHSILGSEAEFCLVRTGTLKEQLARLNPDSELLYRNPRDANADTKLWLFGQNVPGFNTQLYSGGGNPAAFVGSQTWQRKQQVYGGPTNQNQYGRNPIPNPTNPNPTNANQFTGRFELPAPTQGPWDQLNTAFPPPNNQYGANTPRWTQYTRNPYNEMTQFPTNNPNPYGGNTVPPTQRTQVPTRNPYGPSTHQSPWTNPTTIPSWTTQGPPTVGPTRGPDTGCSSCCFGAPGAPGNAGTDGIPGKPGNDGNNGQPGSPGNTVVPPNPPCERQCPPPTAGPPGPSGPKGRRGHQGDIGVSHIPSFGPPGSPGVPGDKGTPGKDGPHGLVGKDGLMLSGPRGDRGTAGITGFSGRPGRNGKDGTIPQGQKGPIGESGFRGSPGIPGIAGRPGNKGSRGTMGPCTHCPDPRTSPGY